MKPMIMYQDVSEISVATAVVTGIGAALAASANGVPGRQLVTQGQIAWDGCDCSGQLALTINRTYPSRGFPTDSSNIKTNCNEAVVIASMSIQLVRCYPGPDQNGNPPTPQALTDATTRSLQDKFIVRSTLKCILDSMYKASQQVIADYIVLDQTPLGPQGNCTGWQTNFLVGWTGGCGCGDE